MYAVVNDSMWYNYDFLFNAQNYSKPVSIDTISKQFRLNGFYRKNLGDNKFVDSYINFFVYPYLKTTSTFDSTTVVSYSGKYAEDYGFTYIIQKSVLTISLYDASKNRAAGIFEIVTTRNDGKIYTVKGFFEGGDKK